MKENKLNILRKAIEEGENSGIVENFDPKEHLSLINYYYKEKVPTKDLPREELEDIWLYDEAKKDKRSSVILLKAMKMIESKRSKLGK